MPDKRKKQNIELTHVPHFWLIKEIDHLDKAEYCKELAELSKDNYSVVNFSEAVDLDASGELRINDKVRVVYLVDIDMPFLNTAYEMAQMNSELGIKCTFNPRLYHFEAPETDEFIEKIHAIPGQEIGYQYEELAECGGDIALARKTFKDNLDYLRQKYSINSLVAHGRTDSGYSTIDVFKNNGQFDPDTWKAMGIREKSVFYYFLENIEGGLHYFNESTRMTSDENISTLQCFKPGDIVVMLHHAVYRHKGLKYRCNPKVYEGLDGVKFLVPKEK